MKLKYQKEPFNFGGLEPATWDKARVAVLPIPYESTTTYGGGTARGPSAIIDASRHMELWDIELGKDFSRLGFFTFPELEPDMSGPEQTMGRIQDAVAEIVKDEKWPLVLGGEHSITPAVVAAVQSKYKKLSVLQIDAHTDLRNEYQGTKYSHACAMRRVYDLNIPTAAVGIRSVSEEETKFISNAKLASRIFYAPEIPVDTVLKCLSDYVYITVDVDGFDSSIMPGTGTPEPGGLNWYQVIDLLRAVGKQKKIVGADIVELAPIPGQPAEDFLAAKLAYKIIGYSFFGRK
ncbi:MAG: agmatinase [Patescibacteria group bacterium]